MTGIPARVADASVIATLAFGEARAAEARDLLGSAALYEPSLLLYELTSIARNKTLQTPEAQEHISAGLVYALSMDIRWAEVDAPGILRLALETGLTPYDAAYLYLASVRGLPLATFDRRMREAAHSRVALL